MHGLSVSVWCSSQSSACQTSQSDCAGAARTSAEPALHPSFMSLLQSICPCLGFLRLYDSTTKTTNPTRAIFVRCAKTSSLRVLAPFSPLTHVQATHQRAPSTTTSFRQLWVACNSRCKAARFRQSSNTPPSRQCRPPCAAALRQVFAQPLAVAGSCPDRCLPAGRVRPRCQPAPQAASQLSTPKCRAWT